MQRRCVYLLCMREGVPRHVTFQELALLGEIHATFSADCRHTGTGIIAYRQQRAHVPGIVFLRLGRNKGRSEKVPQRCSRPCTRAVAVPLLPPSFQPHHHRAAFARVLAPFRNDQELPDLRGVEPCTSTCLAPPPAPARYFGPIPIDEREGEGRERERKESKLTWWRLSCCCG